MYTIQSLWTQAREKLDVTTVIFSNRKYAILLHELANVGANPGRTALDMLDLGNPDLDFVAIQQAEEFYTSLARRGQRARFVRYWGEGHVIYWSPANFADYWREVFEWFGELLAERKN